MTLEPRYYWFRVFLLGSLLLAHAFAVPVAAEEEYGQQSSLEQLEADASRIESALVAPCCWVQTLATHQSTLADEMRAKIRRRLAAGDTPEEIIQSYVDVYSKRILSKPPPSGFHGLLYLLPVVFLGLGALILTALGRRISRSHGKDDGADNNGNSHRPPAETNPEDHAAVRRLLREEIEDVD